MVPELREPLKTRVKSCLTFSGPYSTVDYHDNTNDPHHQEKKAQNLTSLLSHPKGSIKLHALKSLIILDLICFCESINSCQKTCHNRHPLSFGHYLVLSRASAYKGLDWPMVRGIYFSGAAIVFAVATIPWMTKE
jgi:hypothetical protein